LDEAVTGYLRTIVSVQHEDIAAAVEEFIVTGGIIRI
jgi:hypothetical protein